MIAGARGGWQTIIADLSLILFMVTSAAMVNAPDPAEVPDTTEMAQGALPAQGAPLGVYRAGEGGPAPHRLGHFAWRLWSPLMDVEQIRGL